VYFSTYTGKTAVAIDAIINQKNAQTPTGIMISTKKQFHLLGENQRQPSPSNLVLAELRLGLKNRQVGEKWISDDYSYLCKGLK
jgi:hypothetical protein